MTAALEPDALRVALGYPNRLRILIALEERPRGATELATDLGLDGEQVRWAVRKLHAAELVDVVGHEPNTHNIVNAIYGTRHRRWKGVLRALDVVGRSARD